MIYLFGAILLLQTIFWWLFRSPIIILGSSNGLAKGGWLILEHHYDQSEKIIKFMKEIGMGEVSFEKDLNGIKRYAICCKQ